jgi:hypothetical protein
MRQNAVALRPSQRNELISPRFQWAVFVRLGKGNGRVVAKYSISKANGWRLRRDYKVFQS